MGMAYNKCSIVQINIIKHLFYKTIFVLCFVLAYALPDSHNSQKYETLQTSPLFSTSYLSIGDIRHSQSRLFLLYNQEMDKIIPMGFMVFSVDDQEGFPEMGFFDRITVYSQPMPKHYVPLVVRRGRSLELFDGQHEEKIKHDTWMVATIILRWLKEEKVSGRVRLWFQLRIQHMDVELECAAVKLK